MEQLKLKKKLFSYPVVVKFRKITKKNMIECFKTSAGTGYPLFSFEEEEKSKLVRVVLLH